MKSAITILLMMVQSRFSKFLGFWFFFVCFNLLGEWAEIPNIRLGPLASWLFMFIISLISFLYGMKMRLQDICERGFDEVDKNKI